MPGPKMGPRPADFDEDKIKKSPTYLRWLKLEEGQSLKYACREFVKGRGDDDERLMRRILIARRNNLKDHETLKKARKLALPKTDESRRKVPKVSMKHPGEQMATPVPASTLHHGQRPTDITLQQAAATIAPTQGPAHLNVPNNNNDPIAHHAHQPLSDAQIAKEMDVKAIEATRSYKKWSTLADGEEFVYNQRYIKGHVGQDWLLRKNIWRRMRYRRENKRLVDRLMEQQYDIPAHTYKRLKPESGQALEPSLPLDTTMPSSTTNNTLLSLDHLIQHPLNAHPLGPSANQEISPAPPLNTTSPQSEDDHETALQASAAAAAAILKDETGHDNSSLMDPAVVAAAMAAAESFVQQSTAEEEEEQPEVDHDRPETHDIPMRLGQQAMTDPSTDIEADAMAAAVAAASAVTPEDIAQVVVKEHEKEITGGKFEDPTMIGLERPEINHADDTDNSLVLVHDPLQAAALAAQLAQVSGAVGAVAEDLVDESVMDA